MSRAPTAREWLIVRARLVARPALVGCILSGAAVVALSLAEGIGFAGEEVFSLSALVFGFGLLGWSSAALSGRAIENATHSFGVSADWTETSARRAMARIGGFGFGGMCGVVFLSMVLTAAS